ncbi:MAG: MEDS domain-containing protein [Bacillota bacterium]|jgi:hypothetical protein
MDQPCGHIVQLYGGDAALLLERAGRFLGEGLALGEPALIVATAGHCDDLLRRLAAGGHQPIGAIHDGFLSVSDAHEVLRAVMVGGAPDWAAFEGVLGHAVRALRGQTGASRIRVYGEMLGILWQAGQADAALTLEEYWNRLLGEGTFSLFCSYPVDVLDDGLDAEALGPLLAAHSHVVSGGPSLEPQPPSHWVRKHFPDRADAILERARRDPDSHRRAG